MAGPNRRVDDLYPPKGTRVKLIRTSALAAVVAAGALALSACSDNAAGSTGGSTGGSTKSAAAANCEAATINASGSSAQAKAMDAWSADYAAVCDQVTVNYDPSGSGAGVTDFSAGKNDFAGSDSSLKDTEVAAANARCKTGKAINLPMVVSPVAVAFNVKGVDKLTMTAEVLAGIFGGTITTWNDPAIAAINPDAKLPATTITTIHRSKDSGTTDNFAKFLDAAGKGKWTFGTGKTWTAPGGQGAPDSAGIVSAIKATDGSISYVDGPDAKGNKLATASIDSGSGPVEISDASVGKAVAAAEKSGEGNDIKLSINYALNEAGAYPAVLVTYEIVCEKGLAADKVKAVKSFLSYTATDGQKKLTEIGYSPLPEKLRAEVEKAVAAIS